MDYLCRIFQEQVPQGSTKEPVRIKLQMWDLVIKKGNFSSVTKNFYQGAAGVVQIIDLTNEKTLSDISKW